MALRLGRIAIDREFLQSRVARRVFAVFVACSLVPVAAFAWFAYHAVRDQLENDAARALRAASKASGMAVAERLLLADVSLRMQIERPAAFDGDPEPGSPLRRVERADADDRRVGRLDSAALDRVQQGDASLVVGAGATHPTLHLVRLASEPGAFWVGEVDPGFLFPEGRGGPEGAFWVVGPGGSLLSASPPAWQPPATALDAAAGVVEVLDEPHLVASWQLFLGGSFGADDWTIVTSRSLADVHRPLHRFQSVFPWIVGITLCGALGLSLVQIRRTLVPIVALTEGAEGIARRNYETRVEVTTRDEFGRLSEAFNEMARTTGRHTEILAAVNRFGAALSAHDENEPVIDTTLEGVMQVTGAHAGALLLIVEGRLELARLRVGSRVALGSAVESAIPLSAVQRCLTGSARPGIVEVANADENEREEWHAFGSQCDAPVTSYLTVPMRDEKRRNVGLLLLMRFGDESFSGQEPALAESLASQATVAIRKNQLVANFRSLFEGLIELTVHAIDEKSAYTGDHCRNVPLLAELITEAACADREGAFKDFELSEEQRYELRIAALLHDCGKVVTPVHVMDKATKLETIFDRIALVETRFEVLRRDALVRSLARRLTKADPGDDSADEQLTNELRTLDADLAFLRKCNVGGERMADSTVERIRQIAQRHRWTNAAGDDFDALDADEVENLSIRRGTLNAEERGIIQHHVVATMQMLERLPFPPDLRNVPAIAGAHHERMDGTGYPLRLRGDQLSVQARILGLSDVFEALTARDRPYKPGKTLRQTLNILQSMSEEGHIDPQLLDLFLRKRLHLRYAVEHMSLEQIDPEFQTEIEELTGV